MKLRVPETDLAAPVVAWLQDLEWTVYQEVDCGKRADIVATRGPLLWVVEVKAGLSLQLLDQAVEWIGKAHYVSIAIPEWSCGPFAQRCLMKFGIGRFGVHVPKGEWDKFGCNDELDPSFFRKADTSFIRSKLHEDQLTGLAAGSNRGGYSTPFSRTCRELRHFLKDNPRATMKKAIDGIRHHYASPTSARNSLAHWIRVGKVPGVRIDDGVLVLSGDAE